LPVVHIIPGIGIPIIPIAPRGAVGRGISRNLISAILGSVPRSLVFSVLVGIALCSGERGASKQDGRRHQSRDFSGHASSPSKFAACDANESCAKQYLISRCDAVRFSDGNAVPLCWLESVEDTLMFADDVIFENFKMKQFSTNVFKETVSPSFCFGGVLKIIRPF
jgi:hypothetical protein